MEIPNRLVQLYEELRAECYTTKHQFIHDELRMKIGPMFRYVQYRMFNLYSLILKDYLEDCDE